MTEGFGVHPFEGVLVRMSDKWARINSLVKHGTSEVRDESIEDTLVDLANYAFIAVLILRDSKLRSDDLSTK
jgi:Domain of Unknown Function (DUF1599).